MTNPLVVVADLLEALPENVLPSRRYTLGGPDARDAIDTALRDALVRTSLTPRELYPAMRAAIAPTATLPMPDIVRFCGRRRVLPALRAAARRPP